MFSNLQQFNFAGARVYVAEFDENVEVAPVQPPLRNEAIEACSDPLAKRQRYCVWLLLDYALKQSAGKGVDELRFALDGGKWSCDGGVEFSLSHCGNVVAVAVAERPVGVDVERLDAERFNERLAKRILNERELTVYNSTAQEQRPQMLAAAWTQKEALFKRDGGKTFVAKEVDVASANGSSTIVTFGSGRYVLSVVE